eukprot:c8847_g1_i1 orf=413-1342(-)
MDAKISTHQRKRVPASEDSVKMGSDDCTASAEKAAGAAVTAGTEREKVKDRCHCMEFHSLPEFMRDNEFILSYYRINFNLKSVLLSLFAMHNETFNIWTHLAGFLFFLGLTVLAVLELPKEGLPASLPMCLPENNKSEHCPVPVTEGDVASIITPDFKPATRWPLFAFLAGSMLCLLMSSLCHLLNCYSRDLAIFFMRLDYSGIAIMITTSFFPPIYYVFQCTPIWQGLYLGMISMMALAIVGTLFAPVCQKVGTFFYISRIPERWIPGLFDLGGNSHNIFHVLVVAGAYTHYRATLIFLKWRDGRGCP